MECSLVVVVVDVNPVWWGLQNGANDKGLTLFECMDHVLAFINSHVMMNQNNKVAVIASHTNESRFLYPGREADVKADDGGREVRDGKYEHFANINDTVQEEIRKLIVETGQKINSRLLVIKAADDNASQYMNLMNVIFTAQKQSIPVDACILEKDSGLLQQACDITNGVYLQIPQINGLLQYLLWVFLPDPSLRETLVLPPSIHVDYRAACFCHRTLIDIGYVCSVCLSIFCTYSPICSTCHTAFKLKTAPVLRAKKKKKTSLPAT
ncbi:general transcription factor IIH subunit 3-like isoform X2 [Asterias rubens]|uniref:general transcription factor IIH subunit 3-like isoform X2 n=1 Tax=Asterias rubens TaxID=7604 RepID=UPI0014557216|nr:general transcription factor IIH subunit 3-like isoform X2 [Asterias rubens]